MSMHSSANDYDKAAREHYGAESRPRTERARDPIPAIDPEQQKRHELWDLIAALDSIRWGAKDLEAAKEIAHKALAKWGRG